MSLSHQNCHNLQALIHHLWMLTTASLFLAPSIPKLRAIFLARLCTLANSPLALSITWTEKLHAQEHWGNYFKKMSVTDVPKCLKTISNKFQHCGHVRTYTENTPTLLNPGEISFGVLFFSENRASVTDVFEITAH